MFRSQLSEARQSAQANAALATALQRVVDDRTQELVVARGETDSLNAFAQRLQAMVVEAAAPGDGA